MTTIFSYLKRKKLRLAHALMLTVLLSISIYSTYSVIYSFLTENKKTVTTIKSNDNILPFVRYLTVHFLLSSDSVFRDYWYTDSPTKEKNADGLSLDDMSNIALMNGIIYGFDYNLIHLLMPELMTTVDSTPSRLRAALKNVTANLPARGVLLGMPDMTFQPKLIKDLDEFVQNPRAGILVDKTLSYAVGNDFVRLYSAAFPNITYIQPVFFFDGLSRQSLQFTIPLDFLANTRVTDLVFGIMPVRHNKTVKLVQVISTFAATPFAATFPEIIVSGLKLVDRIALLSAEYQNGATYASSAVRTKSECQVCDGLITVGQCRFKCVIDFVIAQCQCVPFTFRRLFHSDSKGNKLPYCTIKQAAACMLKLLDTEPPCAPQSTVPCELCKCNVLGQLYTFDSKRSVFKSGLLRGIDAAVFNSAEEEEYRIYYTIRCQQRSYVLLEQQYQNTWLEMLGQVGGNLGLFLSFTLYGVWEAVVRGLAVYKRRKEKQKAKQTGTSAVAVVAPWLRMARINAEIQAGGHTTLGTGEDKLVEYRKRLEELERLLEHEPALSAS